MSTYPGGGPPSQNQGPNRRLLLILTPFLVLLVAAAATGIGVLARDAVAAEIPGIPTAAGSSSAPANVAADGAVRIGEVLNSGVNSTPTVIVDGAEVTDANALMSPNGLAAVIAAAR